MLGWRAGGEGAASGHWGFPALSDILTAAGWASLMHEIDGLGWNPVNDVPTG